MGQTEGGDRGLERESVRGGGSEREEESGEGGR